MNIEDLILEGERLENTLYKENIPPGILALPYYKSREDKNYQNWISSVKRFIRNEDEKEFNEMINVFKDIHPENHTEILATLRAIKEIPSEPKKEVIKQEKGIHINITNQNQETNINLIIKAFQDELNGKQQNEIQTIIDDKELEPEKKKSKIVETLKKFGGDVASNILANILTNPTFFGF
ncbi:hypothetical protein [Capnocytophaga ochracea]